MSFKKNTLWNVAGSLAPLLVGVISIPILIKQLGIELFGVLTILWVIVGYFSLFDFGVGRALTQQISSETDKYSVQSIIKAGLILTIFTGLVGGLIVVLSSDYVSYTLLNLSPQYEQDVYYSLLIASLGIPITTLSAGLRGVLEGYEKFFECNIAKIIMGALLFLAPVIGVYLFDNSMVVVASSLIVARVIGFLLFSHYFIQVVDVKEFILNKVGTDKYKKLFIFGGWMSITNLLSPLLVNIDRFFISNILGASSVAFYTLPFEFIVRLLIVPGSIGTTLLPKVAKDFTMDRDSAVKTVNKSALFVAAILSVCVVFTALVAKPLLVLFAGAEFGDDSYYVAVLISLGVLMNGVGYIYYTALHSLAVVKVTAKLHLCEFVLYIPLVYVMIDSYGVVGAAMSWCVRTLVDTLCMYILFRRKLAHV
ncbi:membrane protein involved in the export of O-antigen and teichoic acid [Rheinheimera sp. A13L]|uniref:flippase n=1 Tax=Rheinheimera sp. A13L TaxID=506534 RepID=UPI00021254AF|nr:flippase [Rheinheimera sp. A13L]EGM78171.1 membrane protein involved in the export of O-antigen and teichoic acid [Rheinheimera sp. A13L]